MLARDQLTLSPVQRRSLLRWISMAPAAGLLGSLGACGGGDDEPPPEDIGTSMLDFTPENQAATFRNADRLNATHRIARGTQAKALAPHSRSLAGLSYTYEGKTSTVDDYMARNRTSGLIVLKGGAIALERYAMGNTPSSRWTSFSVAKSVTSTLVGAALQDGSIASLDDLVTRYVPVLRGSAYEVVTVRQLMRMTSGVAWDETYSATGTSDVARLTAVMRDRIPGGLMGVMRSLTRAAPPDSTFLYNTGETTVEGAVVVGATGKSLSRYLSEKIWVPAGMEADAYWVAESESDAGLELGGGLISATLRDYARFGQFFLNGGVLGTNHVLPTGWRDLAGHPDNPVTGYGKLYAGYPLGYGYNWWSFQPGAVPLFDGSFTAQGIFGQFIYVNPAEDVVAAVWSAWPSSWVDASEAETYALLSSALAALQ